MAYFILGEREEGDGGRGEGVVYMELLLYWSFGGFMRGGLYWTCFQTLTLYLETSCRYGLCQGSCKLRVSVS